MTLKPLRFALQATVAGAALFAVLAAPAQACPYEAYIGTVCTVAFSFCPDGYLPADGAVLQVAQNQALFSLLGNRFGGNGTTTFALPDLRGKVVVGTGTGVINNTTLTPVALAQQRGAETVTLATNQVPLAPHTHPATFTATTGSQNVSIPATPGNLGVSANLQVSTAVGSTTGTTSALGNGQTGYLAGIAGYTGTATRSNVNFTGPYTTTAPAAGATATLPVATTVTGSAGTAATTATVTTVTGGSVAVQPNTATAATTPVRLVDPGLGLTVCIANYGIYPTRP